MTASDLLAPFLITTFTGAAMALAQCLPLGSATVLIRAATPDMALALAARSGAALVALPAPGFAVLHGDAARIRGNAGRTTLWQGAAQCSASRP
jgi:hypothetical protein